MQYVINNSVHSSLRASSSKLLFGCDLRGHTDSEIVRTLRSIAKIEINFEKERQDSLAKEATGQIQAYNKVNYDKKHRKPTTYNKPGD